MDSVERSLFKQRINHSTQLPPNLASAGGQVTLGMPAGYAHTSCAPGACHSAGYSKGGGAKPEGAP